MEKLQFLYVQFILKIAQTNNVQTQTRSAFSIMGNFTQHLWPVDKILLCSSKALSCICGLGLSDAGTAQWHAQQCMCVAAFLSGFPRLALKFLEPLHLSTTCYQHICQICSFINPLSVSKTRYPSFFTRAVFMNSFPIPQTWYNLLVVNFSLKHSDADTFLLTGCLCIDCGKLYKAPFILCLPINLTASSIASLFQLWIPSM